MHSPRTTGPIRRRRHSRGQSLVEFALVVPILLLIFAGIADFGRAFYAYVAVENAAKEGAFFGSRTPLCSDAGVPGCADPNNVVWRVRNELKDQGIRDLGGAELTPTVDCLAPNGTPRSNMRDCAEGDTYAVALSYPFRLLTPILGSIIGDLDLATTSHAVVLNLAFDPTPGASIQKYVSPIGAINAADVIAKCLEPNDSDANGYYRSPCRDSSTPSDPVDELTLRFEQGTTIAYRLIVSNSGGQNLTGLTVSDSKGSTGCSFPSSVSIGATLAACNYSRTAPTVGGSGTSADYENTATVDSLQTVPTDDRVTVIVEKPPARLRVLKWVSPFALGDDGDGDDGGSAPAFGTDDDLTVTYRSSPQVSGGSVWFKIIVRNTGGRTATGLAVTDSRGAIPRTATCPAIPSTLAAGATWECRYSVPFSSATPATTNNTAAATGSNVVPDGDDSHTATMRVQACTGPGNRTVPNLIGLDKGDAQSAWTTAGFTGTLDVWSGGSSSDVVTQSRPAYDCVAATASMTVTRNPTP
ncbi:MAG: TadE/TadG family type IV pilus assembly protein [Candidatus Limnocylindrales bacterium]